MNRAGNELTARERLMSRLARYGGVRIFRLFTRTLDTETAHAMSGGMTIRRLQEHDLAPLYADARLDLSPPVAAAAFARGDLCVAAFDQEELAGYCWLAFSPTPHLDGVWADFAPDAVWTYKSLVRPSYRGRGIAPALYRAADRACRERGRGYSILCVESHNRPSIAAGARAGYAPAGYAAYLCWRASFVFWRSPAVARADVRFYRPAREA